ncbi:tetratricopeptide repeat protein [Taibaiella soli]|uniref:Zinc-finger domain-containing protein n=1 Tax=Taibaiella soli TaxID=1649169 RepID=A0A2W2BBB2_9BACT|nr:tetratricopeptide repeat protein [Taibaiella soli]PZF73479.1 hypothetical protein DN068_08055 [Taibaiella soli]
MNNQLSHIFDESVCLTKRQLKDYVSGLMSREECHAIELHLNSCPLCSMAVEGLSEHPQETVATLAGINTNFLQEHFSQSLPQVHLNSIAHAAAPAASLPSVKNKKHNVQPLWRNASIAAVVVVCCGLAWLWESDRNKKNNIIAQRAGISSAAAVNEPEPEVVASEAPQQKEPKNHKNGSSQKPPLLIATTRAHSTDESEKAKAADKKAAAEEAKASKNVVAAENARNTKVEKAEPAVAKGLMSAAKERSTADSEPAPKMAAMAAAPKERVAVDALDVADAAYDKKYYNAALDQYKEAMKNPDAGRKYKATLGAARCYIALGQKNAAKELLEKILSDKHADKEPAQSMLKDLE